MSILSEKEKDKVVAYLNKNKQNLIALFFIVAFVSYCSFLPPPILTPEQQIEKQFSGWDGSHINLEKFIKENMNDPDSYKHIKTIATQYKTYLIVVTKFSGRNSFGGMATESIKAKVSLSGEILEILEL